MRRREKSSGAARGPCAAALLLLLAVTFAAYVPALDNGFVWDDEQYIVNNHHVTGGLSRESALWALTAFEAGNWHPLTWISHMLDVDIFGAAPFGPHLINILFHLANTTLAFVLFFRLTGACWRSLLVSALFALHPLHVESVAWAAERKDVLSAMFGLMGIIAYIGHVRRPGAYRYLTVVLLFVLGLTAKPMLVTFPFVLLLLDFWPLGRLRTGALGPMTIEKLPLFIASAASCAVTWRAQESAGAFAEEALGMRISNAAVSYVRYLGKMMAPFDLAAIYPYPQQAWALWQSAGALLLLACIAALALAWRRTFPWVLVGWLWYLGTLVPVIGIVQVGQQALADRYTYVPAVGLFVVLVWSFGELVARQPACSRYLVTVVGVAFCALAIMTTRQVGFWKDTVTLFDHAAKVVPGNRVAHYNLGVHYQKLTRDDEAIGHFREVLKSDPGHAEALTNLGVLLSVRGLSKEAEGLFLAALRSSPGHQAAYNNLGREYKNQGRYQEAEVCFRKALGLGKEVLEPQINLGALLLETRRWPEAEAVFAGAVLGHRDSAEAQHGLGIALARQGRFAEAAASFKEAQRLRPDDRDLSEYFLKAVQLSKPMTGTGSIHQREKVDGMDGRE